MKAFKTSRTPSLCAKRKATLGNAQRIGSSNFLQRDARFFTTLFCNGNLQLHQTVYNISNVKN